MVYHSNRKPCLSLGTAICPPSAQESTGNQQDWREGPAGGMGEKEDTQEDARFVEPRDRVLHCGAGRMESRDLKSREGNEDGKMGKERKKEKILYSPELEDYSKQDEREQVSKWPSASG